eukprot:TRINITY_DN503_c0_g1_i3.p1 TRINITY_DN503_c0_g1~~TRINITY_DN503_c0_g1_i3.p1  ORF type:complete len:113 (-),score=21.50 TRINITY_DN503_c0_g1_i3:133-471(-)
MCIRDRYQRRVRASLTKEPRNKVSKVTMSKEWKALCTDTPSKISELKVAGYPCTYISASGNKTFSFKWGATEYTLGPNGVFTKGWGSWNVGTSLKGKTVTFKKEGKPYTVQF